MSLRPFLASAALGLSLSMTAGVLAQAGTATPPAAPAAAAPAAATDPVGKAIETIQAAGKAAADAGKNPRERAEAMGKAANEAISALKIEELPVDAFEKLTEQRLLTRRFLTTLAQEVMGLHQRLRQETYQWSSDALMPLMQHTLEHKQMLESHMVRLKALAQETQQTHQRGLQFKQYAEDLERQLAEANEMLRVLRRPAPVQRQGKVVSLPLAARASVSAERS